VKLAASLLLAAMAAITAGGATNPAAARTAGPATGHAAGPAPGHAAGPASPEGGRKKHGVYLGCGRYCLQAGEYGGPDDHLVDPAQPVGSSLHLDGGMLPVTVRCDYSRACRGAIVLWHFDRDDRFLELGRSDLLVPAAATLTIAVRVPPAALDRLRHDGKLYADLVLDLGDPACPDPARYECVVEADVAAYAN
jgi:hypothetical protein